MADVKEVGKRIKAAADEDAKANEQTPDAEEGEKVEVRADLEGLSTETVKPEPEAKPTATRSPEQTQKAFDRAVTAFHGKLCDVFEVEELTPAGTPGVIGFLLPGYSEKRTHDDFQRCATCNGWGKVLTGSLKVGDEEHDCPDPRCAGRGYWQKAVEPKVQQQATMVALPAQVAQNGDQWDRPSWLGDPRLSSAAT